MMGFPRREVVERLRAEFPAGALVELVHMEDIQAPPEGTRGKVIWVDDTGTIHVAWENGSSLGVVYGEDRCRRVDS